MDQLSFRLSTNEDLPELWKKCGGNKSRFRDALSILVAAPAEVPVRGFYPHQASPEAVTGFFHIGESHQCVELPLLMRIHQQTNYWIELLSHPENNSRRLAEFSPVLSAMRKSVKDFEIPFTRTIRMLLFFEALFCSNDEELSRAFAQLALSTEGTYFTSSDTFQKVRLNLRREVRHLRAEINGLDQAINELTNITFPIQIENCCLHVSLPLLIQTSILYSQCEFFGSILWEHFSAGRARDELQKKWSFLGSSADHLLDLIALLIRYQSAPGQLVRQTGSNTFLREIHNFTDLLISSTGNENKWRELHNVLVSALNLIGVVEEARNHFLPRTTNRTLCRKLSLNAGLSRNWYNPDYYKLLESDLEHADRNKRIGIEVNDLATKLNSSSALSTVFRSETDLRNRLSSLRNSSRSASGLVEELVYQARRTPNKAISEIFLEQRAPFTYTWAFSGLPDVPIAEMTKFKRFLEDRYLALLNGISDEQKGEIQLNLTAFSFGRRQASTLRTIFSEKIREWAGTEEPVQVQIFHELFKLRPIPVPRSVTSNGNQAPEYVIQVLLKDRIVAPQVLPRGEGDPDFGGEPRTAGELFHQSLELMKKRFKLGDDVLDKGEFYLPVPLVRRILDLVQELRPSECGIARVTFTDPDETLDVPLPEGWNREIDAERNNIERVAEFVNAEVLNQGMAFGFRSYSVAIIPASESKQCRDWGWSTEIDKAKTRKSFDVLIEHYLRDYNVEMEMLSPAETTDAIAIDPLSFSELPTKLEEYVTARKKKPDPKTPYFLAIDHGGTLTKVCFYSFKGGVFNVVGVPFQVQTPGTPDKQVTVKEFAEQIVNTVVERAGNNEEMKTAALNLTAIGVSWPGPIRDDRARGTSGLLGRIKGFTNKIVENDITKILRDLDLVQAYQNAWEKVLPKSSPQVSIINDGNADAAGVVVWVTQSNESEQEDNKEHTTEEVGPAPKRRLVVIKLGTGLAGTVFIDGRLVPGLFEWGKVLLDLGQPPKNGYPAGDANASLSARTLPRLFAKLEPEHLNLGQLTKKTEPGQFDSQEIGMLLACFLGEDDTRFWELVKELRKECGLRDMAATHDGLDVEIIRRVEAKEAKEDQEDQVEPELREILLRLLKVDAMHLKEHLQKELTRHGNLRLAKLLRVDSSDLEKADNPLMTVKARHQARQTIRKAIGKKIIGATRSKPDVGAGAVAELAAQTMGRYLGDMIVLLHDLIHVDEIIISGGVVSGTTGKTVKEEAQRRVQEYELTLKGNLTTDVVLQITKAGERTEDRKGDVLTDTPPENQTDEGDDQKVNYGTLGAAAHAAAQWLYNIKQQGINKIRKQVVTLEPSNCAKLWEDKITFERSSKTAPIHFSEWALSREEVERYLSTNQDLRVFTSGKQDGAVIYRRWPVT